MSKHLSIQSTFVPSNYRPISDKVFNSWSNYIHGIKPKNTVRPGGVCYQDADLSELLTNSKIELAK